MPWNGAQDQFMTRSPPTSPILQYSDRFIPGRRSPTDARNSLHLSKRLFELNEHEKSLYRQGRDRDPFRPLIRNAPLVADQYRQLQTPHRSLSTGISTEPSTVGFNRWQHGNSQRAVSQGAIWSVGGSGPASDHPTGVLDGRGGRLASGTNAPLFASQFLPEPDPRAELEAHERRLALALDVDQSGKILSPPTSPPISPISPSPSGSSPSSVGSPPNRTSDHTKPIWRDNQWIKQDSELRLSKYLLTAKLC